MPYDLALAARMRPMLLPRAGMSERGMFGGVAFFLYGNMCCGVWHDCLVVRLDPTQASLALKQPNTRPMDVTGKPMKGWVLVEPAGCAEDRDLFEWIQKSVAVAASLPPK